MRKHTGLEARAQHALSAGLVVCGLLTACAVTPNAVRDLPELPAEFARDLAVARTAPVFMTTPIATAAPVVPRPAGAPLPLAPSKACTSIYKGYVTYPITVCHPPTELYDDLVLTQKVGEPPPPTGATAVLPVRYFKLTSHPRVRLGLPWFCTVRSGPWFGHVEGAQICNTNPNVRAFTAQILGAPETVVVLWSGSLDDVPPPLKLPAISQSGEFCTCCSGTMCPDGRCVPNPNQCSVMPPALK